MLQIHQFPCLNDNYGFLVHCPQGNETVAIDTPDADRYLSEAAKQGWTITQIWNTHWHPDHAGGNEKIKNETGCTVTGPAGEKAKIPALDRAVGQGDTVQLCDRTFNVLDVPGHTLGHVAYFDQAQKVAFVGDALFALGCGRVFEGTPEMMWESLSKLKVLPEETVVYCAHEYTASNAKFALSVDPENAALQAYAKEVEARRAKGEWTVPTLLSKELAANPFLRADVPAMQAAMGYPGDAVATFAEIRGRKDNF